VAGGHLADAADAGEAIYKAGVVEVVVDGVAILRLGVPDVVVDEG